MRNRPPYAIASVDAALHLAAVLRAEGPLRVTDAAGRLGVSVSTAHRLLAMLVYRDFAEQQEDRRYRAGPVWGAVAPPEAPVARLRELALPHLRRLVDELGETANVSVLTGSDVRFVASVECDQVLRVGDRTGRTLPAHRTSGGKAVLASLSDDERAAAVAELPVAVRSRLVRELATVRRHGFALNDQDTESGLTAVGVAVPPDAAPGIGVSLAVPSVRYRKERVPAWTEALHAAAAAIGRDLAGG